ncbi:MAG: NUDIX domain-containing protein [Alphaproteobacteria bacterium]|nr:NUDIX domain-containing protein [Alphaproteobacteria bacterium]
MDQPKLGRDDVTEVARVPLYRGFFRANRYRLRHARFGGGETDVFEREVFERPEAACLVLYDPARDVVVLTQQFRCGPFAQGRDNPFNLGTIAGIVEPGEVLEEVARREALEEAGLTIDGKIEKIAVYYPSPGGCSEKVTIFWAEVDSTKAGGVHGLAHEHEDIRVVVLPLDEALARIADGTAPGSDAVTGLLWLAANRTRLRQT